MTLEAEVPDRSLEKGLLCRLVRIVAFGTGTDRNRPVHVLLLERRGVVAPQTELRLILAHVQQETPGGTVWLVARSAVALLNRFMHHLLLAFGIMAITAECCALRCQIEALSPFNRVFLGMQRVTGGAVAVLDRYVRLCDCGDGCVACGGKTGRTPGGTGSEKEKHGERNIGRHLHE